MLTYRARGRPNGDRNPSFHEDMPLWIPAFAGMTVKIGDGGAIIVYLPIRDTPRAFHATSFTLSSTAFRR